MPETMTARCCVTGGGPAGVMTGFLLARAGVDVVVLEKHADFFRDFRGDTIHPSTMQLMDELGLLAAFLERPHQELRQISGVIGDTEVAIADFSHLPTAAKFVALMPQWHFLDFLSEEARRYPTFRLIMQAEATDLLFDGDRVAGVRATTPDGELEVRADLTIGADGRHSVVRERAGLEVTELGAPMDVLWMRIPRRSTDPDETFGRMVAGHMMILLNRDDYWQCAFIIRAGGFDGLKAKGLAAFHDALTATTPFLADRVETIASWDQVKLLTVMVDRLTTWHRPGLVCIGDAAHAMSPIGGVGINLAIQDAVATANILAAPLLQQGPVPDDTLGSVQRRREWPTRATQRLQIFMQDHFINRVLEGGEVGLPLPLRLLGPFPALRRIPARVVGLGFRPEHIRSPDAGTPRQG